MLIFMENERSYGCLMAYFSQDVNEDIIKFGNENVLNRNLIGFGRENDPHVTILYGLHTSDGDPIQSIMSRFELPEVEFGEINKFVADEHDVIHIEINCREFHKMNAACRELDHTNSFKTYKPHLTLAYVARGSCDHLIGKRVPSINRAKVSHYVYSSPNDERIVIV